MAEERIQKKTGAERQTEILVAALENAKKNGGVLLNASRKPAPSFYNKSLRLPPGNALMMAMHSDQGGFKTNVYTMFRETHERGEAVRKGQKGVAVVWTNPNQYVIVLTHPMIYDTVYGSLLQDTYTALGDYWSTKALSSILVGYPQAVTFGGHLHFPLNDPRSIWQGDFTALGCASTSYMAIDNGGYEDRWFIEIDLSTEAMPVVMDKCKRYHQYLNSGIEQRQHNGVFPITVWIVPDEQRKQKMIEAIKETFKKAPSMFAVITAEEFEELIRSGASDVTLY